MRYLWISGFRNRTLCNRYNSLHKLTDKHQAGESHYGSFVFGRIKLTFLLFLLFDDLAAIGRLRQQLNRHQVLLLGIKTASNR